MKKRRIKNEKWQKSSRRRRSRSRISSSCFERKNNIKHLWVDDDDDDNDEFEIKLKLTLELARCRSVMHSFLSCFFFLLLHFQHNSIMYNNMKIIHESIKHFFCRRLTVNELVLWVLCFLQPKPTLTWPWFFF